MEGARPRPAVPQLADVGKKAFVPYTADYFFYTDHHDTDHHDTDRTRLEATPGAPGCYGARNSRSTATTSAWSSSCGNPETVTVPTGPTLRTMIGNAPPCAA